MSNPFSLSGFRVGDLDLMNFDPENGVEIITKDVKGLGATGTTADTELNVRRPGGWTGESFDRPRIISAVGTLYRDTGDDVADGLAIEDTLDRIKAAVTTADTKVVSTQFTRDRWVMAHKDDEVITDHAVANFATWSLQMASDDYRMFGDELSAVTGLPSTSGGLTVPFTVPFTIDAVTVSGQVSLVNPGKAPGPVRLRIDGPVTGPVVTHVGSGAQLVFSAALTIGVGEWLDIDMEAHTVLANGQSGRSPWIASRGWSSFEPGQNTWAFSASLFDPDSKLTVFATPANK
jgi:phage-related protein